MSAPQQPTWLTTVEVATRSRRHPVTVRRALEAGELHGNQPVKGGRWLAHIECVDAWVAGHPCAHQRLRAVAS